VEHLRGVVFTVTDGLITRYEEFLDKQDALASAGLAT
jgi:hypothetical protein